MAHPWRPQGAVHAIARAATAGLALAVIASIASRAPPGQSVAFAPRTAATGASLQMRRFPRGNFGSRRARRAQRCAEPPAKELGVEDTDNLPGDLWDILVNTDKYIEEDRLYRRPVFGYTDWKRHRSSDRFSRNLRSLPISTTFRASWKEVLAVTVMASVVCLWNDADVACRALNLGQDAFEFIKDRPMLTLPPLPFTISSASLSLLLVFRTNSAYGRWWEARCIWGAIINTCRDIVRQAIVRFDPKDVELKAKVTRLVSAYPRSLIYHLGERTEVSDQILERKYRNILTDVETTKLLKCTHKPMTVTGMLSDTIHSANLPVIDQMKLDEDLTKFSDYYGMCERIFKTPMPLSYTRLTSRFLFVWLLTLPFALYGAIAPHWVVVPISALLASFLFSIEEIGIQVEEPFSVLPMGTMADGIDASIFEALEFDRERASAMQA